MHFPIPELEAYVKCSKSSLSEQEYHSLVNIFPLFPHLHQNYEF